VQAVDLEPLTKPSRLTQVLLGVLNQPERVWVWFSFLERIGVSVDFASQDEELSDRSLVAQIRSGDQEAANALYERYSQRLFGLAHRQMSERVRRLTEPEDIVQSAFRSLFRGVYSGSYDAPEGCSLWQLLAVIAMNKVRRKVSRDKSVQPSLSIGVSSSEGAAIDVPEVRETEGLENALRDALECLRPMEQDVVRLRVQGFTVEEISEKLNRSRRTVERTLQQARESLADHLLDETAPPQGHSK